jgi:hypothetical protein
MPIFREFEFATKPDLVADQIINRMSTRFSQPELKQIDIARILTGFNAIRTATGKKMDALFFSYMRESALKSGKLNEGEFYELFTTLPEDGYGKFMSMEDIAKTTEKLKQEGLNVGLKFGHYRRLTLGHIFEFVYVRKACDHLILIIESGERASKFKGKLIELSDQTRVDMFKKSCLVNTVGITNGLDYSDDYYRKIVKMIKPTTLFISESWPEDVQQEYTQRAKSSGAEPFMVPKVVPITTSMMESQIFRKAKSL